jgi:hypothetical protein
LPLAIDTGHYTDSTQAWIDIPGKALMDQLKNIYQVGRKWYHMPAEGATLTLK